MSDENRKTSLSTVILFFLFFSRKRFRDARCRLSPGQVESQVDASWNLRSTCGSVLPGLAWTCVDLR